MIKGSGSQRKSEKSKLFIINTKKMFFSFFTAWISQLCTSIMKQLIYKEKRFILAHSFEDSSIRSSGPISLASDESSTSWQECSSEQNYFHHELEPKGGRRRAWGATLIFEGMAPMTLEPFTVFTS
jgi:hypothetical protein